MADDNPLTSLLDALTLLIEQARAYDRVLPPNDYRARAAIAVLNRLAQRARSEAISLQDMLPALTTISKAEQSSHPFSPREFQVLCLAADGLTNKEIAYRLGISDRTVQYHINMIFNKSATNSRTEAVALALRMRWIPPKS